MLDLGRAGFLLGFFLLLTIQFLVTCGLFGLRLQCGLACAVIQFGLAFLHQTFLLLLLLASLLGLFFIDQAGFEQLVAQGKTHD